MGECKDLVQEKIQPRPIKKKAITYIELDQSDESSGEEEEGDEEGDSGQDEEEEEEVKVVVAKSARRKVVKSLAVITDEMEEDTSDGEAIHWSQADRRQAEEDAA